MALAAGRGNLIERFVMQIAFPVQRMGGRRQNQLGLIGYPALAVALIAGRLTLRASQKIFTVAVLAVTLSTERRRSVGYPVLIDGMTAKAADSLVLNAAGCENEAQPD